MNVAVPSNRCPNKIPDYIKSLPRDGSGKLAIIDADGTIWTDDVNDDLTKWCIDTGKLEYGHLWEKYLQIYARHPPTGCEYALNLFKNVSKSDLNQYVAEWWEKHSNRHWIDEVLETLFLLKERNFTTWVVSGTPTELLGPLVEFLPVDLVVGMDFEFCPEGLITGSTVGIPCAGEGKAKKVKQLWGDRPISFACGNSMMDAPMMELATDLIWSVYPDQQFYQYSKDRNWPILKRPSNFVEEEKFLKYL